MPYDLSVRGWMSENELTIIEQLAQQVPENGIIIEVGSMMGRTACAWAMSAHPSVKIYCLDIWSGDDTHNISVSYEECIKYGYPIEGDFNTFETFQTNTQKFSNIIPIHVFDPFSIPHDVLNLSSNVVFIDASHKNPNDWFLISYWMKKIVPGGILCGHDLLPQFPDVEENVKKIEGILLKSVTRYPTNSLWSFLIDPISSSPNKEVISEKIQ